jgi:hypothetical protein
MLALSCLALAGCGGTTSSSPNAADNTSSSAGSTCAQLGENVDGYDVLASGSSRGGYLTLLHQLQRDCRAEAARLGLTGEGLPPCRDDLSAENCSAYARHERAKTRYGLTPAQRKQMFRQLAHWQDTHPGQDEQAYTVIAGRWHRSLHVVRLVAYEGASKGWAVPLPS